VRLVEYQIETRRRNRTEPAHTDGSKRPFDASGTDSHIWYARYSVNSGWDVAAQLSHSNARVQDRGEDPQIGFDAAGNALVIWNRFDGTN
jgi:hypothetical protein